MGERDSAGRGLLGPDGKTHTYDELKAMAGPEIKAALEPAEQAARHKRTQDGIATVGKALRDAHLDALIFLTDDEHRLFDDDNFPSVFVYHGETVPYVPSVIGDNTPAPTKAAAWAYGRESKQIPGVPKLADHILKHLPGAGFDVSRSKSLKDGVGIGHHIGFANTRLLENKEVPFLPILFNASFPPNIMSTARFYGFGEALAAAVSSYPEDLRVGVLAVGGMSHTVINEAMDRQMVEGARTKNRDKLVNIPEAQLYGGNGQGRVWITAAAALNHLTMTFDDYVAAYRSEGGTGCGMAFGVWG
jgi:3-O-methylgallate 3,4-dioxygenase